MDDDLDDLAPDITASHRFQNARASYDNLLREMLIVWDVVVGLAVVMWLLLRLMCVAPLALLLLVHGM